MGQEGQLGLGEDRIHISSPCLLRYSQPVTQIQAGDSYSAAVTAGGELLLWGQIPCVSRVSDHQGLRRLWTPQSVPLAGRKVCDVACGTWHILALTTGSGNRDCAHPETETCFRDLANRPFSTEHTEKENTVHDLKHMYHRLPQGQERPERSEGQGKDEDSGCAKEEAIHKDGPNKDKGAGALHKSAFATARSAIGMDKRGSSHSSVTSDQEDERKGCRTARSREPRKEIYRSRDVVFTTLHFLPRPEGQQCRPTASIFPRLVTEQQAHSKVLAETRKERSTQLAQLSHKSGVYGSILPSSKLTPKPPARCTSLETQRVTSGHHSRIKVHTGLESPHLSPGQQVLIPTPSFHSGPQVETALIHSSSIKSLASEAILPSTSQD
ncbi:uncharacterized protein LOC113150252 [Anabas testudineus]|uniref:uncharacterized protein LOC113150252 n=1 Tax=Anabas testudineus TaxID=64144 RepID=UPI000E458976|nr:uncharacterized protein LOC113150252 [Anabas testudineus]